MLACCFCLLALTLSIEGTRPGPGLGSRSGLALVKFMFADMPASIARSFFLLVKCKNASQRTYLEENVE